MGDHKRVENKTDKKSVWHTSSVSRRDLRQAGPKRSAVIHPTSPALGSSPRLSVAFWQPHAEKVNLF